MNLNARSSPLLEFQDVNVTYPGGVRAARDINLTLYEGETMALVGESGCGKTTLTRAVLGLLPSGTKVDGSIKVCGTEVVTASESTLRALRGRTVGFVAQDPYAACDPLRDVRHHLEEAWVAHGRRPPPRVVEDRLGALGITRPQERARQRPHQWSGGMLQRATIAAASANGPALLVADEPTSALDAELADDVLRELGAASRSLLLVTHDLGLAGRHADWVAVIYAGRIVEFGPASLILNEPRHPYSRALLAAIPRPGAGLPEGLPGTPPDLRRSDDGCSFAPRCPLAYHRCRQRPELVDGVACWKATREPTES